MTITVEPLRRGDVPRCAQLERVLFPGDDPWSERAFESELDSPAFYVGAYDSGAGDGAGGSGDSAGGSGDGAGTDAGRDTGEPVLVGYAGIVVVGRPGDYEAEVHTIGVDPAWQGRGIGKVLLRALLDHADSFGATVFLDVRTDNDTAIALYEAHGFAKVGVRRRYYRPSGADAYTMSRPAQPARAHSGGGRQ